MSSTRRFTASIQAAEGGGAYVVVPFDVEQEFGRKRVRTRATIDGEPYRGLLVRMGGPHHILIVLKEIRERIGKGPGDEVEVTVEEDLEPRVVEAPADLREALQGSPEARAFFDRLSYTDRREYVRWIEAARRERTRRERIARSIAMLAQGKKAR